MAQYDQFGQPNTVANRSSNLPYAGQQQSGGNDMNNNAAFYNSIPNVSPEMLNMGLSAGQDMLNKQREKWMPGMSSFWLSLKYYFAVS